MLCDYGCGEKAIYQFKNGKWCCSIIWQKCDGFRNKIKELVVGKNNPNYGKNHSYEAKQKMSKKATGRVAWNKGISVNNKTKEVISEKLKGRIPWNKGKKNIYTELTLKKMRRRRVSEKVKNKLSKLNKITISKIEKKYPLFFKIEKMRYNPDNPGEKEIQVHCKNHNCKNSKEKSGWFTPTGIQLYERIRQLEKDYGNGGCYFYCSDNCKNICPLFRLNVNYITNEKQDSQYTQEEYQTFREFVLERDNNLCQYCGEKAIHVHHERPQKLEPFFALDPFFAWACCKKCHYEKGHPKGTECSSGGLANVVCT